MKGRVATAVVRSGVVLCGVLVVAMTARAADFPHTLRNELSAAAQMSKRGSAVEPVALRSPVRAPCEPPISSVALSPSPTRCLRKGCTCRCKKVNMCCC